MKSHVTLTLSIFKKITQPVLISFSDLFKTNKQTKNTGKFRGVFEVDLPVVSFVVRNISVLS